MSRPMLILTVGLSAYAALDLIGSLAVGLAWRTGLINHSKHASATQAQRLAWLRAVPTLASTFVSLVVVVPAFVMFEPYHESEDVGPVLPILAALALGQLTASLAFATLTAVRTRVVTRTWLRSGTPLEVTPPAGVPAYAIDSPAPIVALVGVFSPKLIAARAVIEACTREELTAIVAHERGHLYARDNLKRWLMACAPDALRWTPIHHEIAAAWHAAAEDAADDVATRGDDVARVSLAALIVKIARLAPEATWPAATVSPFVERDGLPRRVRRLLAPETTTERAASVWHIAAVFGAAVLATILSPGLLGSVFAFVESLVKFGR